MNDDDVNINTPSGEKQKLTAIDSHVQFWKYDKNRYAWMGKDMKLLQQDHLPQQADLTLKRNDVQGVVAIEADHTELETLFLYELSKSHSIIKGVVGWVDLAGKDIEDRLSYFSQFPVIKGWRHHLQAEKDGFMDSDDFRRGLKSLETYNYTFDLLIKPGQAKEVINLVNAFPSQRFVLDHMGKPDLVAGNQEEWTTMIRELASAPNVYCKVSGLFTQAHWKKWSAADFYPYLDVAFEHFGIGRLMYGSNWPVMLLSGMYVQWKSLVEKYMENYKYADKESVFHLNAREFYNL